MKDIIGRPRSAIGQSPTIVVVVFVNTVDIAVVYVCSCGGAVGVH